jgi:hypothetical protein
MLRWGAAALAAIVLFLAGCPEGASSPAGAAGSRVDWRSGADQGSATLVDAGGVIVRAACPTYGTRTGPYLSLTARTNVNDARTRVRFASAFSGKHRFALSDFDRSYGRWDLLGAEPGRVRGRFAYESPDRERLTLSFDGSGGRSDGQCDLDGEISPGA